MSSNPIIPWLGGKRRLAVFMKSCKGKVMVSINDHPEIRTAFAGLNMMGIDIKYSVGNNNAAPGTSHELVITNWDAESSGGLF